MSRRMTVRLAHAGDAKAIGRLLHDFNVEYSEPAPDAAWIAGRLRALWDEDLVVLLVGDGPDGLSLLRYRPSLWSEGPECYLAELYVVPARRGNGLGRALLEASLEHARSRGADRIELGTSEDDVAARALYEKLGFTNRERPPDGPVMHVYEREL